MNTAESNKRTPPAWMSIPDVAADLGVSDVTLWRWIRQGRFPRPVKLSPGITRIPREAFDAWCAERRGEAGH